MFALIQNGKVAVALRVSPSSIYPADYAKQFIVAPDEVEVGWSHNGSVFAAPPPPTPSEEATLIKQQIAALEASQLMPRATREFMLLLSESMFSPAQLAANPGYQAVKAFDLQIKALRDQLL